MARREAVTEGVPRPVPAGTEGPTGYGVAELPDGTTAVVAADGDHVVDLCAASRAGLLHADISPAVLAAPSLNPLLAAGPRQWRALGAAVEALLVSGEALPAAARLRRHGLRMRCPVEVADYVDGYGGLHHAVNMGRILRPDDEPLLPNWRHLPVAYHGRAGTITAGGAGVRRPRGQVLVDGRPRLQASERLDVELEVGYVVGVASDGPVDVDEASDHVFGVVLVNDWSARDIQAYEYQPLGPYLGKSFATTISPWVTPFDAVRPYLVPGLTAAQDPPPPPYLRSGEAATCDLHLEILLQSATMHAQRLEPVVVSQVRHADAMYWSMPQQLAHATVNGASLRVGDLFASGTVSGTDRRRQGGSFMELTWGGAEPLELPSGERRRFVEDGDRVILRGWCGEGRAGRVVLGDVDDVVLPAPPAVSDPGAEDGRGVDRRGEDRALLPPVR
jgi:fumarylacetoacetase